MVKVCKFGGTSLATREQIEKSLDIMLSDPDRRYMVVSAPGARFKGDAKVTDLLINLMKNGRTKVSDIISRFQEIFPDYPALLECLESELCTRLRYPHAPDYEDAVKAFGEYASVRIVNQILLGKGVRSLDFTPEYGSDLNFDFRIIGKGKNARPDPRCYPSIARSLTRNCQIAVIPGFYGINREGKTVTLPRGGSDITGAAIARAVSANVYENWTDEDGLKAADPRIVPEARTIPELTYGEARELAYMGFKLQDACFEPIVGRGIVLHVRNTNNPLHEGTRIVDKRRVSREERIIGVACQKDLVSIGMRKIYIDQEVGFGRKMMGVLEKMQLPYEHTLDGVDTTSIVVAKKYLGNDNKMLGKLAVNLDKACKPERIFSHEFALISVAGEGMKTHYDVHARVFGTLAREGISVRMIDEGADDLSMFVGVDNVRAEDAVRAVYREFFR